MIHTLCAIFFIGASHCPNFSDWFMIHCVLYFSLVLHTIPISVIDSWYIVSYLFPWCFTLSQFQWLIHDTLCAIFFLGASHCPNFRDWFMIHCLLCFSSGLHTVPVSQFQGLIHDTCVLSFSLALQTVPISGIHDTLRAIFFLGASHCPNFRDWFMIFCVLSFSLALHTVPISGIDSWYFVCYLFPWRFTLSQFQCAYPEIINYWVQLWQSWGRNG